MTKEEIINKQFDMIGESFRYKDIPEDGLIEVGKKTVLWYEHYRFKDEEQYLQWKDWAIRQLSRRMEDPEKYFDRIDLNYGMTYRYGKQKGQLDLF